MNSIRFIFLSLIILMSGITAWGQDALVAAIDKIEASATNDNAVTFTSVSEKRVEGKLVGFNKIFVVKDKSLVDRLIKAILSSRTKAYKFDQQIQNKNDFYYRIEFKTVKDNIATYDIYSITMNGQNSYAVSVERKQKNLEKSQSNNSSTSTSTSTSITVDDSLITIYSSDGTSMLIATN